MAMETTNQAILSPQTTSELRKLALRPVEALKVRSYDLLLYPHSCEMA